VVRDQAVEPGLDLRPQRARARRIATADPFQVDRAAFARFHDLGLEIALWSDVVTPELLDWIDAEAPRWVSVGDASLVRAWIDD